MVLEAIRAFNDATPFRPYEIRMTSGERHRVPHPDFISISPRGSLVIIIDAKDRPHHLSTLFSLDTGRDPIPKINRMDWMRSEGRLHVMQDPEANTAIIWVKPRAQAPRVSLAGDFNQHLPRHSSRSNTHIPVAFPAVGH